MADPPAGCARTTGAVVGEKPATAPVDRFPASPEGDPAYDAPASDRKRRTSRPRPITKARSRTSSSRTTSASGSCSASTPVTSPSFERPKCRRSPTSTPRCRSWASRSSRSASTATSSTRCGTTTSSRRWSTAASRSTWWPTRPATSAGPSACGTRIRASSCAAGSSSIRDGVIQAMEVLTPPVGRKFAESIRQIKAFQHVRASKGTEATPAGWEPGQRRSSRARTWSVNVWKVWQPKMEK